MKHSGGVLDEYTLGPGSIASATTDRSHVWLDVDFCLLVLELCKNEVEESLQLSERFCQIKIHSTPWSVVPSDLWQLHRVRMVP